MNKYLRQAKTVLKNNFIYQKVDNVLVVSEDKSTLPYAYVIYDDNMPNTLIVSFAVDFPISTKAAQLALKLRAITHVELAEEFYIAKNGHTFWGDEACKMYEIDTQIPLEDLDFQGSMH